MSRKKLVMIPSVGISLVVLSVAVVVMGGYIPHESEGHGLMVEQSAQVTAKRADVAVIGTIGDSSTYLIYHNVGNLIFPKVYTLTELTVSDVLLGDTGLQGDVITIRTLGGTYNSVTTTFSPVPEFSENDNVLVYLHEPATEPLRGTYYDSQGIQSTFNLGQDGKYYQQWSKEALEVDQIISLLGTN